MIKIRTKLKVRIKKEIKDNKKKSPLGEVPVPGAMDVAIKVDWGGGPVVMILGLFGTPFLQ